MTKATRAAKVNPDTITIVKPDTTQSHVVVMTATQTTSYAKGRENPALRKLAVVGGSFKAVTAAVAALPVRPAKMANGLDTQNAPNCAKAMRDQKASAVKAAPAKPAAKSTAKAAPAPKATKPAASATRTYKKGPKVDTSKPDTFRQYMLATICAHKDTASAKAAHAASGQYPTHRLDFNWSNQNGYIVLN